MSVPARVLKTAVLDLLAFEGTADMSALPVTDLIDLMSDRDEVGRLLMVIFVSPNTVF